LPEACATLCGAAEAAEAAAVAQPTKAAPEVGCRTCLHQSVASELHALHSAATDNAHRKELAARRWCGHAPSVPPTRSKAALKAWKAAAAKAHAPYQLYSAALVNRTCFKPRLSRRATDLPYVWRKRLAVLCGIEFGSARTTAGRGSGSRADSWKRLASSIAARLSPVIPGTS